MFVDSLVLQVLSGLVPGVTQGQLSRGGRMLRWVEAGSGSPVVIMDAALGEPGTMAWAAVMPRIAVLLDKHSRGEHGDLIRDAFQRFAKLLTEDPGQQARILDAYVACYSRWYQIEAFPAEFRLFDASIPEIHRIRTEGALPDVPIVVLSATEGAPEDHRRAWTKLHEELAASVPRGRTSSWPIPTTPSTRSGPTQ